LPDESRLRPRYALFLLSLVMMLNVIDRQMLSILIEPIKRELDVGDAAMGLLTGTSFALLHVVAMIPLASLADRGSRRSLIAWGLGTWSALTVLTGLARSFGQMFWIRLGLGVGEATSIPASHSLVADLFPLERRATALSMLVLSGPIGQMIAYAGAGWINAIWGWRVAFFIFGLPGVALALLIAFTLPEPSRGAADGSARHWAPVPLPVALRKLLAHRSYRHLTAAGGLSATANYALLIWAAPLWMRGYGLDSAEAGTALALATGPANALGVLLAGRLADRLGARDPRWLVWLPALACAGAAVPALAFVFAPSHGLAIGLLALTSFIGAMVIGPVFAAVQSVAPPPVRSVAAATLSLVLTALGLGLAPPLVGLASDLGEARHGVAALRYGVAGAMLCLPWAALHLIAAGRRLRTDLETVSAP
jgi:predicted MFS family arabinose efflux permease